MEKKQNKVSRVEIFLLALVIVCVLLILIELFTNVSNELQSSLLDLV